MRLPARPPVLNCGKESPPRCAPSMRWSASPCSGLESTVAKGMPAHRRSKTSSKAATASGERTKMPRHAQYNSSWLEGSISATARHSRSSSSIPTLRPRSRSERPRATLARATAPSRLVMTLPPCEDPALGSRLFGECNEVVPADAIDVLLGLEQCSERAVRNLHVDVPAPEKRERPCPVQRLSHSG